MIQETQLSFLNIFTLFTSAIDATAFSFSNSFINPFTSLYLPILDIFRDPEPSTATLSNLTARPPGVRRIRVMDVFVFDFTTLRVRLRNDDEIISAHEYISLQPLVDSSLTLVAPLLACLRVVLHTIALSFHHPPFCGLYPSPLPSGTRYGI